MQAANWGQNLQASARGAADQLNRFVEGEDGRPQRAGVDPERRDFWDDLASPGEERAGHSHRHERSGSRSDVIGTAAMRKGPATSSLGNPSTPTENTAPPGKEGTEKGKDDWDDNW